MPQIPEFPEGQFADRGIAIERSPAHVDPNMLAAPGLAMERGAQGTEQFAQHLGQLAETSALNYYNDNLADAETKAHDNLQNGIEDAQKTGDYQGFAAKQMQALGADLQQRLANAPGMVASRLKSRFALLQDQIASRASSFEHQMTTSDALAKQVQGIDDAAKMVYRDPSMAIDAWSRINSSLNTPGAYSFPPDKRRELTQAAGNAIFGAAIRSRAQSDPQGLAADFAGGKYDPYLDPRTLESLQPLVSAAKARSVGESIAGGMLGNAGGGGSLPSPGTPSEDDPRGMVPVIRASAARYGVDPETALKVAKSEGLGKFTGDGGTSYGAFQLHVGGGLGDEFRRDTGLDPSDPKNEPATIDYAMRRLAETGWTPYHGAARIGVGERQGIGATAPAGGAGVPPGRPDLEAALAEVQRRVDAHELTPQEGDKAAAIVSQRFHHWSQTTAQDRAQLLEDTKNGVALLQQGRDWTPDLGAMRRLLPAPQYAQVTGAIDEARDTGNAVAKVQFATPDDLAAERARLTALPDSDAQRRVREQNAFERAVSIRDKSLKQDPAAYALAAPAVAAAWQAAQTPADPQNPAPETQAAVAATLAEEERLGVLADARAALTKPQAAAMVRQIMSADPATTDIGAQLDRTAQVYGPHWRQVFGDLVKAGLPPEVQNLAAMDTPDQAAPRTDYQHMLGLLAAKGGAKQLREAAPHAAVQAIDQGLDQAMAPFRATVRDARLYDSVRNGVRDLAYYYAFRGQEGGQALNAAFDGVIARKYDFDGSIRAPKGTLGTVERAGDQLLGQLNAAQLPDIGGNPQLTPDQRREVYLGAIRHGEWRVNPDESGLTRMALFRDGTMIPAHRADGSIIQFRFDQADQLAGQQPELPPAPAVAVP